MRELKIRFKSDGKIITKTAITYDTILALSTSKRNEAFDLILNEDDDYWSLFFYGENENVQYEIEFEHGFVGQVTPRKAITWVNDIITDVQNACVIKNKYL